MQFSARPEGGGYGPNQIRALRSSVAALVLASVSADSSGPVAYFEEMTAAGRFLYEAGARYRHNGLIMEILGEELPGADRGEEESDVTRAELLARVGEIDRIVRRDDEGMEFRRFLLDLASSVVSAARKGPFGPRVSTAESAFLDELEGTLGLRA